LLADADADAGAEAVAVAVAAVSDAGDLTSIEGLEDGRRCSRLGKSSSLASLNSLTSFAEGTSVGGTALTDDEDLTDGRPCKRLGISSSLASLVEGYLKFFRPLAKELKAGKGVERLATVRCSGAAGPGFGVTSESPDSDSYAD